MTVNRRNFFGAALVILGPVALLLGLAILDPGALAEATIHVDGRPVQFQLRSSDQGVSACINFDRGLIGFRNSTGKTIPGATHQDARNARFHYDESRQTCRFTMETAIVEFQRDEQGKWQISPVLLHLPATSGAGHST